MWKQGALVAAAFVAFFVASNISLDLWRRVAGWLFVVALGICLLMPLAGMLHIPPVLCTNGACRWFSLGPIGTFQPAELLKFSIVIFVSSFLAVRAARGEINSMRKTLLPLGIAILVALFTIVILQKDLGTGLSLIAIVLAQLIISGLHARQIVFATTVIALLGVMSILMFPHRLSRIATFLGSGSSEQNYQFEQAMLAIGSGGPTGRGLGQSVQAFGWLPEQTTDAIFAILGETLGFVGLVVILAAFFTLLYRIIKKVDFLDNMFLRLIVGGVFGWIAAQMILNIGSMIGITPLTGVPLPLVSVGGTSLLFVMFALGVVFAISRFTNFRKTAPTSEPSPDDRIARFRRNHLSQEPTP
jgi:cell division protein FtsW